MSLYACQRFHSDASILDAIQTVRRAHRRSAKEGEETAQDLGWNAVQWCVAEEGVGVANVWMFDWAHTYLQGGLLDVELGLLFKTFQKQKVADSGYKEFREFLASWIFPRGRHRPDNLFTDEQIRLNLEKSDFSCGASDLLSLAPILLKYFRDVVRPRGRCIGHIDSILAVLESVELLQSCKDGSVDADRLEDSAVALAPLILIQCELCPRSLRKGGGGESTFWATDDLTCHPASKLAITCGARDRERELDPMQ